MPKKYLVQDYRKQPSPPMSPPHANYQAAPANALLSSLGDEDEDDICPVCESECTCRNRDNPPSVGKSSVPTRTFTSSSTTSSHHHPPPSQTTQPLKIKLTVPPNLKFRKNLAAGTLASSSRHVPSHNSASHAPGRTDSNTVSATIPHQMALSLLDPAAPKRRGRPSKAVLAAREAARAALAAAQGSASASKDVTRAVARKGVPSSSAGIVGRGYATKGRKAIPVSKKSKGKRPMVAGSLSSDDDPQYPTFMSAASTSSLTSSSESSSIESASDSSESSDDEMDGHLYARYEHDKNRLRKELSEGDALQKRRDHGPSSRLEIKPRRQSVDPVDDMDADSEDTSDEDGDDEDDSEDDSEDEDEEDVAVEADVEEEGVIEPEEIEMEETDGKLGVSFGGLPSGYSEDEEESFDADVFFANLDDSSDSCGSPAALRLDPFSSDVLSDGDFSADEEDALLLMDIDPSVQVRRTPGEFEVGVELDGISLGLDGQLLFPSHYTAFAFDDNTETDVEMTVSQDGSSTDDQANARPDVEDGGLQFEETDGESTEDELVDENGLPNEKAMMLFRWPAPVSTIDPLSTVGPSAVDGQPPDFANASQTLRMALASMSTTPTPSDLLAGRMSMDEIEEMEDQHADSMRTGSGDSSRSSGFPTMGQFATFPAGVSSSSRHAVIDGKGAAAPSPYPKSRVMRIKRRSPPTVTTDSDAHYRPSNLPQVSVQVPSSDEAGQHSQAQTSDDPSSTEAIDLNDVLDAAFLDSDFVAEPGTPSQTNGWLSPSTPSHSENLSRWDRIPVATFRRTRETSILESTPGSDSGLANLYHALLGNEMLGTPKSKSSKLKASSSKRYGRNGAASNALVISPVLLPVHDGDRTPTGDGQSLYNPFLQHDNSHQQKSRRELRKDKAMMKRKMLGKNPQPSPRHHQQHSHRHHFPNMKTRGTNSVQRTHSSSHIPHLNL